MRGSKGSYTERGGHVHGVGEDMDTIEIMAQIKKECPPHDLRRKTEQRHGMWGTLAWCQKCNFEVWIANG